jgi:hypothetical protein
MRMAQVHKPTNTRPGMGAGIAGQDVGKRLVVSGPVLS